MNPKCIANALHLIVTWAEQHTDIAEATKILKKDKLINIRITNALHEQLTEAASNKGLNLSTYIYDALVKQLQDKKPPNNIDKSFWKEDESFWKEHINQLAKMAAMVN